MRLRKSGVISVEINTYEGLGELRATVRPKMETDVAVALAMIRCTVVDVCEFIGDDPSSLSLSRALNDRASLRLESPSKWHLRLGGTQLELLEVFTLRSIRDGAAEVDHIDLEVDFEGDAQKEWTFTLQFPAAAPLLSEDELRRRLGLGRSR
jgi:hypothetical protein